MEETIFVVEPDQSPDSPKGLSTNLESRIHQAQLMNIQIEVWTDLMCPFCYIGKRKLEIALKQGGLNEQIDLRWRSFQLNPEMNHEPGMNVYDYLAQTKGWTLEYSREVHQHVSDMASQVGLEYDFDRVVIANSFDAHRLIQFARTQGKANELSESLFSAYFCKGIDTGNPVELVKLAVSIGLNETTVKELLSGNAFSQEVKEDIHLAQELGIRGVPFFLFNGKYAISGAQPPEVFLEALKKCQAEEQEKHDSITG